MATLTVREKAGQCCGKRLGSGGQAQLGHDPPWVASLASSLSRHVKITAPEVNLNPEAKELTSEMYRE